FKYTASKNAPSGATRPWHFAAWTGTKPRTEPVGVDAALLPSDHLVWWNKNPWIAAFTPVGQGTPILKADNTEPAWVYEIQSITPNNPPPNVLAVTAPAGLAAQV